MRATTHHPGHVRQRECRRPVDSGPTLPTPPVRPSPRPRSGRVAAPDGAVPPRNKFNVFWDEQKPCEGGAFTATQSVPAPPETTRSSPDGGNRRRRRRAPRGAGDGRISRLRTARAAGAWTKPDSQTACCSRAASAPTRAARAASRCRAPTPALIRVTDQCLTGQTAPAHPVSTASRTWRTARSTGRRTSS